MLDLSNLTILVADPSPYMVKIFRAMLRGFGVVKISEAQDGVSALEVFKANVIDIAIVDYALDTINGVELTELLRADENSANRFAPIIMVSAYTERWRIEECRDAGATEFLRKPLCAADLYRRMQTVINEPRPFVRSKHYFGPDRRRKDPNTHGGEERRGAFFSLDDQSDDGSVDQVSQDDVDALFG